MAACLRIARDVEQAIFMVDVKHDRVGDRAFRGLDLVASFGQHPANGFRNVFIDSYFSRSLERSRAIGIGIKRILMMEGIETSCGDRLLG